MEETAFRASARVSLTEPNIISLDLGFRSLPNERTQSIEVIDL